MVFGGLQKFSLVDFPGKISAIVFTRGCGFRCPYCHNPELVDPARYATPIPYDEIMRFLGSRKGRLQGVVVTGGEPTFQDGLPDFLTALRRLGLSTKVDTNGSNPDVLNEIIARGLVDYFAMDLKAPLDSYSRVAGVQLSTDDISRSLRLIVGSGLPHEIRTTYVESLLSLREMTEVAALARGCERFVLQRFRPSKSLDAEMLSQPVPSQTRLQEIKLAMEHEGLKVILR